MRAEQAKEAGPSGELSEEAAQRFIAQRVLETLRQHRTVRGQLPVFVATALIAALFVFGPLARVTHAPSGWVSAYFAAVLLGSPLTTLAFHVGGRTVSTVFLVGHALEVSVVSLGAMALIHASGSALSAFWLFHLSLQLVNTVALTFARLHRPLFAAGPFALTLVYALVDHDLASAATALFLGVLGSSMYEVIHATLKQSARADARRLHAERALRELAVLREKERLARDLHDGLGAELAAMVWRARALERKTKGTELSAELGAFSDRIGEGMREMRNIVWATDAEVLTLGALVEELRVRCVDIAGDALTVRVDTDGGDADRALTHTLAVDVLRAAQEGVRNAARHAKGATSVVIDLRSGPGEALSLQIEDDGARDEETSSTPKAQSRGLDNIRRRAAQHGGSAVFCTTERGSRLRVTFGAVDASIDQAEPQR